MATAQDPVGLEIGVEVHENHIRPQDTENAFINLSAQHHNIDPPISSSDDGISVHEVLVEYPQENAQKNQSFLTRLKTGNIFSSGKNRCFSIIKSIAGEAQKIGHKAIQGYYQDSSATELPTSITDACQIVLSTIRKYNDNNILVQEKWLSETEYLLQNKVLTIGVFGRHKAGKSTLLNALLHHEALPTAVTNETAFILRICHMPSNHHGSSCIKDTEQFLSMKEEETKGRRAIQKAIHKRNIEIRGKAATIGVDELTAHVPFLCRSTGDINVVLLDSPGLSESNELGISEVSEHQLMTCSVFLYVFSCLQLGDSIDTDSLKAIVSRDPDVFAEKRILIAVTRLDEYEISDPTYNDESDSDSDDEIAVSLDEHVASIKKIIQGQCKDFVSIPDDCIVPLCATGALEARKEKLGVKSKMKQLMVKLEVSTAEELEEISQIPLLEEKLSDIADKFKYLWHCNIVRDCTRYLDQAMKKLDETKDEFMVLQKEFDDKVKEKEDLIKEFETVVKNLNSKYAEESEFSTELGNAYDEDLKANQERIDKTINSHFQEFQSKLLKRKTITLEELNSEAKKFFESENESLKKDLKDTAFNNLGSAVNKSTLNLGSAQQQLKQCLASYCNASVSKNVESHLPKTGIVIESIGETAVDNNSPLKLEDLEQQRRLHANFIDKVKLMLHKLYHKFLTKKDPRDVLLGKELDACLKELEITFEADCQEYFKKIRPMIIKSYLEDHKKIVKDHITDVEKQFFEQKKEMESQVKTWTKKAKFYKEMVESHSALCKNLMKQKDHLVKLTEQLKTSTESGN